MEFITILTPTYNRRKELERLYKSLCNQTYFHFKWLIIDDGSFDDTENFVKGLSNENFSIEYRKKENGGKHTALNMGFSLLDTELVAMVDSDDYLTSEAVKSIKKIWNKYRDNNTIMGMVFKKITPDKKSVSDDFISEEFVANYNQYVINKAVKGDKFEVFRSSVIKSYPFPEYKNEKFVGEGVLWSKMSRKYDMVFVNEGLYVCEYLEEGLTKSGREMRLKNPNGGMFHAEEYLDSIYVLKVREKNALLFLTYAWFSNKNILKLMKEKKHPILLGINLFPSFILYKYWKKKYVKENKRDDKNINFIRK